eukprot:m.42122 g.42122  ORF g.42122 m.42122 type:complete len:411 (+) comp12859_c0_seq1:89-1321(+)
MASKAIVLHMQCIPSCFFDRIVSNQTAQGACVECDACQQWFHLHCLNLKGDGLAESYVCEACEVLPPASSSKKRAKLMNSAAKLQRALPPLPRNHDNICYDFRSERYPSPKLQDCHATLRTAFSAARDSLASTGIAILNEAVDVTDLNRALDSIKQGNVLSGSIAETDIWPMAERYKCIRQLPLLLNQITQHRYCTQCKVLYSTQRTVESSLQQLHHGDAAHGQDATACLVFLTSGASTVVSHGRMRYRGPGGGELRKDWRKSPLVLPSEAMAVTPSSRQQGDVIFLQGDVLHASPLLAVTEERCIIYVEFSNYPNLKLYDQLYPQQALFYLPLAEAIALKLASAADEDALIACLALYAQSDSFDTLEKMTLLTPILLPLRDRVVEAQQLPVESLVERVRTYNAAIDDTA